jgi:hypothetical protein
VVEFLVKILLSNIFKYFSKFLKKFIESDVVYVVAGSLLGLSILFLVIHVVHDYVGYTWVTVGRVTYKLYNPLIDIMKRLYVLPPVFSFIALILLKFSEGFRSLPIALYIILIIATYILNPIATLAPLIIITVAMVYTLRKSGYVKFDSFILGLIYSIACIEFSTLIYTATLLSGFRVETLANIVKFEVTVWSLLWLSTLAILMTTTIIYVLKPLLWRKRRIDSQINYTSPRYRSSVYLLISVALATFVGIVGYIPTVNSNGYPLNVDWVFYYNALQKMLVSQDPISEAFKAWPMYGDRPLYMLILYTFVKIFKVDPKALCLYHNVFLFQLYTVSTYYMAKKIYGEDVACYAALIASATPNIISFIYGGFQANLFTLSLIQFAIGLMNSGKLMSIPLVALISLTAVASHIYTWIHFVPLFFLTSIATVIAIAIRRRIDRFSIVKIVGGAIFIAIGIAVEILAIRSLGTLKKINIYYLWSQIEKGLANLGKLKFQDIWNSMEFYLNIYTGGSLNNPLYWLLLAISTTSIPFNIDTFSFTYASITSSLLALAINPLYTYRILINTPTAPVTAYILTKLSRWERILLIVSLYSITITKILSYIPGLKLT